MEAQREVEVAQTILTQPESVLDYTCFKNNALSFAGNSVFQKNATSAVNKVLSGVSLGCVSMANIWKTVRCGNAEKGKIFKSLDDLIAADPRAGCSGGNRAAHWQSAAQIYYPPKFRPLNQGGYEQVDALLNKMDPTKCSATPRVETGVVLARTKLKDGICVAPGCYYNGSSCQ